MKRRNRRAVRDGNQRCLRQPRLQRAVEARLGLRIEACGRFVEEQPVRFGQQRSRQRHTLLLAAGQLLRPVLVVVEPCGELRQARVIERLDNLRGAEDVVRDADR